MSNKEYENMRGRRASADGKWNKKAKKEQDRQARHQRSELIERRTHSKQKKHDKHHLLHVRSLTHRHSDYITFTTRQLLHPCPGTWGSPKLFLLPNNISGWAGRRRWDGGPPRQRLIPAKNARDRVKQAADVTVSAKGCWCWCCCSGLLLHLVCLGMTLNYDGWLSAHCGHNEKLSSDLNQCAGVVQSCVTFHQLMPGRQTPTHSLCNPLVPPHLPSKEKRRKKKQHNFWIHQPPFLWL